MFAGYSEQGQGSQERGPNTFTFDPPGTVQGRPAEGQAVPVQGGIRGQAVVGNTASAINLDSAGADHTIKALLKFSGDLLAPHIKAAKEEQFITGMQRAASGEALTDIINEQPWYTKIFGDGPLVEGARAYEVEAKATNWATLHDENMQSLRLQSPDSIPKYLMNSMEAHLTGDPATDTLIKGNMIKVAPALIKRQTKEHFKYLQERTSEQRTNAIVASADNLASMRKADVGMYGNEDFDNAEASLLAVSTPTVGADPKAFWTDFKGVLGVLAEKGNFHAINAYDKAGVFKHIPITERAGLERQLNQYQAYHATQAAEGYVERIAKIKFAAQNVSLSGQPLISADQVAEQFDAINRENQSKTGNPALVVRKPEQVSTMVSAAQAVLSSQKILAKEAAKEQDHLVKESLVLNQILQGDYINAREGGAVTRDRADEMFYQHFKKTGDLAFIARAAVSGAGDRGVNDKIRNEFMGLYQSGNTATYNVNFQAAYELWDKLYKQPVGGPDAAAKLFSEESHRRMLDFSKNLGGRDAAVFGEGAFQSSLKPRVSPGYTWKTKEVPLVTSLINKQIPELKKDNKDARLVIENAMAYEMSTLAHTAASPIEESWAAARRNGLEYAGSYAWRTAGQSAGVVPFDSFLTEQGVPLVTSKGMSEAFEGTMDGLMKARQLPAKRVQKKNTYRASDRNGEAQFQVLVTDVDDVVHSFVFSTKDIREEIFRRETKAATPTPPNPAVSDSSIFSPPI